MQLKPDLPWMKINDYLLEIGMERDPRNFCIKAFKTINTLIPFDTGMLYILQDDLKPKEQVLIEMSRKMSDEYLHYYSELHGGQFSYLYVIPHEIDWDTIEDCEYKFDFIKAMKINHSTSINFYTDDHWMSAGFVISRTRKNGFTQNESMILKILRSHLDNLYANLFVSSSGSGKQNQYPELHKPFSRRELDIAEMLLRGMSPKQISSRYFISLKTVYNHLASMFDKAGVSSQRELLVKLMNVNANLTPSENALSRKKVKKH